MRQPFLIGFAVLFFAYEQLSFVLWMRQHGGVGPGLSHAWATLMADPMVLMAWNDMAVFTAVVLTWLWRDITATGRSRWWWPATLLMGCPPLLVYLARRAEGGAPRRAATP